MLAEGGPDLAGNIVIISYAGVTEQLVDKICQAIKVFLGLNFLAKDVLLNQLC